MWESAKPQYIAKNALIIDSCLFNYSTDPIRCQCIDTIFFLGHRKSADRRKRKNVPDHDLEKMQTYLPPRQKNSARSPRSGTGLVWHGLLTARPSSAPWAGASACIASFRAISAARFAAAWKCDFGTAESCSKVFVSDDEKAVVGTIDLDYRSLYHHFECATYLYKTSCIPQIAEDFEATLAKCRAVTPETIKKERITMKILGGIMKLIAPLM